MEAENREKEQGLGMRGKNWRGKLERGEVGLGEAHMCGRQLEEGS